MNVQNDEQLNLRSEEEEKVGLLNYIFNFIKENLAFILILMVFIYYLVSFDTVHVSGESMFPTLDDEEKVLIKKSKVYKQGDIVVFIPPNDDQTLYIKRIIGVEGDYIEFRNENVYRNNQELQEDYLNEQQTKVKELIDFEVDTNEFLVLGDNRNNSNDSRHFGLIHQDDILGKMVFSYTKLKLVN